MEHIAGHWLSRLFWLVLLGGAGVVQLYRAADARAVGAGLTGLGLVLLGLAAAQHPPRLRQPIGTILRLPEPRAPVAPAPGHWLRVAALLCLALGLAGRFIF